ADYDRLHPPEDYYGRRLREKREAKERERRRELKPQPQLPAQQSPAERQLWENNWNKWAIDVVERYLMSAMERDGWLSGAIGQALGHYRHKFETEIAALRDKLAEAKAELNSTTAKLHDGINTRFAQLPADEAQQVEQARGELQAATTTLHDEIAALRRELTETTNKLQQRLARLPLVKTWTLGAVAYTGDVFVHDGNVWQAKQDTGQQPGDDHWILLARAGKDGLDGRSPRLRGLFSANERYKQFDITEYDGTSFVATCDDPGIPGLDDGWKFLARRGVRGPAGETGPRGRKGERGAPGEDAPTIINWTLDPARYRAVPTMSDGTQGAVLELRGLFEEFVIETQ